MEIQEDYRRVENDFAHVESDYAKVQAKEDEASGVVAPPLPTWAPFMGRVASGPEGCLGIIVALGSLLLLIICLTC